MMSPNSLYADSTAERIIWICCRFVKYIMVHFSGQPVERPAQPGLASEVQAQRLAEPRRAAQPAHDSPYLFSPALCSVR